MSKMMHKYETILYWSDEDNRYVAEVPELAGCMADGETMEEALRNVAVIVDEWIETADTTYRSVIYYNKVSTTQAEAVSVGTVVTVNPIEHWRYKEQPQDPIGLESAWMAKSGKYLNVGLLMKTGRISDEELPHNIGLSQDTVYTYGRYGKDGGVKRNYFLDCYIEGTTDFIFGPSVAWFENCHIHSKKNSYVTAASTFEGQKWGYVFHKCRLTAAPGIDKCYLGRPWGAYAKTVFIECELGSHILPDGWHDWEKPGKPDTKKNSYYAEYKNYGPGAASKKERVKWSRQLTDRQAAEYTFENVMYQKQDGIVWNPYDNR